MTSAVEIRHILAFVILFTALVSLALGGLVLMDSPRRTVNRLFTALASIFFISGLSFIGLNYTRSPEISLIWSRLYTISLLFVSPLFYHLVLGSIGNEFKNQETLTSGFYERVKQLAYVFSGGWFLLMVGGLTPQQLARFEYFSIPDIGKQFWVAALLFGVLISIAITLLAKQAMDQRPDPKEPPHVHVVWRRGPGVLGRTYDSDHCVGKN
jgi:hypothetical protein